MNQLLLCIQSQDDVPVVSYSGSSRKLQCFAYPVSGNRDAGKTDVVKNCNQAQRIQSSKKPDTVNEESTSSEAVDKLRRVTKAGCQLLSLFQMLKTKKRPAKERTQRTIPVGTLKNTFEREEFVSNGLNSNRGFIYEENAIEDVAVESAVAEYVGCTVHQHRENEPEAKMSTIILEKA
ncbi:thylakoid lumenal 17.4 kDa protein, chloroplastic [Dorcoceras hygrometricum]|uniref:Thylakoid lumenal 17.4 kDa protein, chloroplastic n=1 Tax=Dorcoceras hygrometricum TaxID=472368 RepID=A0A2Z7CFW0_9LAMI|nr:thylakoid lumenal 17.4 kDa protein, chloroplastic [Dorcoceras hygrometricum]